MPSASELARREEEEEYEGYVEPMAPTGELRIDSFNQIVLVDALQKAVETGTVEVVQRARRELIERLKAMKLR